MTDEMLSKVLNQQLSEQFEKNMEAYAKVISAVVPENYQTDPNILAIIMRSSLFTAQFTSQFMIRYLEETGLLVLPPDDSPILYPIHEE